MPVDIPDLSLDLINDALEYHSHVIVNGLEDGDVKEHWDSLRFFWKISNDQQFPFGRIYHRCRLAELVYHSCHQPAYGDLEQRRRSQGNNNNNNSNNNKSSTQSVDEEDSDSDSQHQAMVYWTTEEWEGLQKQIRRLLKSSKRMDANRMIRSMDEERPQDHHRAKDEDLFGKRIKRVADHIKINKILSAIRIEMEEWLVSNSRKQPHVDPKDLREFWDNVEDVQDKKMYKFLRQFLHEESTRSKPKLAPMDHLRDVLKEKPCNLELLQADVLQIAMNWNKALFQNGEPALSRLGYGDIESEVHAVYESEGGNHNHHDEDDEEGDDRKPAARTWQEEVDDLSHARARLRQAAPDPLHEEADDEMAGSAQGSQDKEGDDQFQDSATEGTRSPTGSRKSSSNSHRQNGTNGASARNGEDSNEEQSPRRQTNEHTKDTSPGATVAERSRDDDEESEPSKHNNDKSRRRKRDRESASREDDDSEITEPSPGKQRKRGEGDASSPATAASEQSSRKRRRRGDKPATKKKGLRLRFDSDDETDDVESVRLSELPRFRQPTPPRRRTQRSRAPRRRFFTAQEKDAIKEGVRRYGHGKWREILDDFPDILKDRTNVQIKDCVRTMLKNGEIE